MGRYGHVSFIIDPAPLRITVQEVAPPYPAKLLDQARRVLALAEQLPPIELVPDVVELDDLAQDPELGELPAAVPRRRSFRRGCDHRLPGRAARRDANGR